MKPLTAHKSAVGAEYYTVNVTHKDKTMVGKALTKEEADELIRFVEGAPGLLEAVNDLITQIEYPQATMSDRNGKMIREPDITNIKQAIERVTP